MRGEIERICIHKVMLQLIQNVPIMDVLQLTMEVLQLTMEVEWLILMAFS